VQAVGKQGIGKLTVEVRRRALGLTFVEPAIAGVPHKSGSKVLNPGHLLCNAVVHIKSAANTAVSIYDREVVENPVDS
jgi:hypothetical protein